MPRHWANLVYSVRKKSMSLLGAIAFGLMCHGAASASAQEALWKTYMEAGEKAYDGERYQTAGIMFAAAKAEAEHFGPDDPRLASTLEKLADVLRAQKRFPNAESLYERALAIQEKRLGPGHAEVAAARHNLVDYYSEQRKYPKADLLYEKAIALLEKQPEAGTGTLPKLLGEAAEYYYIQKNLKKARDLVGREIAFREKLEAFQELATALGNKGLACSELGDFKEAEFLYKRAIEVRKKIGKDQDLGDLSVMQNYAELLRKLKRAAEAEAIEVQMKQIRDNAASQKAKP